jgi:hypothetical protein
LFTKNNKINSIAMSDEDIFTPLCLHYSILADHACLKYLERSVGARRGPLMRRKEVLEFGGPMSDTVARALSA